MTTAQKYRVQIDEKAYQVSDPVITGRQLLDKAQKRPVDEYLIFQQLKDGQLEEIRLDETVDLRKVGVEKFITQKSDRSFRFVIDGRRFEWGLQYITGRKLKDLAGVNPDAYEVWLEVRGEGSDRLIGDTETVDLQESGVERFYSKASTITITVTVNNKSVNFSKNQATGLEIKKTAIQQGVSLKEDFILFEVKPNSPLKQIGDNETITLHQGQVFRSTADDDNSEEDIRHDS